MFIFKNGLKNGINKHIIIASVSLKHGETKKGIELDWNGHLISLE